MSVTIADLFSIPDIQPEDLLHILDASNSNEDDKVNIGALTTYLNTALDIPQTIASVNGLQAALDGKSDIGHTHTIQEIVGLSSALDLKLNSDQANIVGRIVNIKGVAITVPDEITGVRDDRIPDTVIIGEYLQFDAADGGINNISGDTLKTNLSIDLVDNTSDASKPVSTAQQSALDLKVDTTAYNTGQAAQDTNINTNATDIATNVSAIALNTQKVSFDAVSSAKLDGIEALADVTDTENVWGSLGISGSGSTGQYLTQRGVFVGAPSVSVNKSQIDAAIGASPGGNTTLFYNQAGAFTAPEGGDDVTKQVIDNAIGVFPTGDSAQFYNEQGNFIDAVYDSIENAPVIRNATIETIVLSGTRSNVQARLTGVSELSVITMQNTFDSSPTQYTTTFTSPNTTFTPALVFPAGSQGRQLSLTEADGTLHRFCYLVNGNYRLLAGGLTGTVRLGPVAVATTATVTAAVTVPDQTAGQTITLTGDETGTFAVGDFISPQANNFGAYRGIFIDSITFDGTNTVIVGPSNGATTFNTTSVLRNAGPATEIQGTIPTFSGDPDIANTVYSSSIPATEFTTVGVNTSAHLIQVANTFAALETAITTDGVVTDNGDGTSSITVNYNTETNIDSSFTITGGLNNMESIVNVDGMIGDLSPATTVTVIDPEATEVVSFTSSAATTATENVDEIAAQLVLAINNNIETPINFDAEYDAATNTIVLTAERAGNTNPWTIIFDNNGTTGVNAGNLGYTSSQSGELVNQMETLSVVNPSDRRVFQLLENEVNISNQSVTFTVDDNFILLHEVSDVAILAQPAQIILNGSRIDKDFSVRRQGSGDAILYDAGTDTLSTDAANIVGFGGGADGLSITDTVNLNLLDGTTVLSTVVLPSSGGGTTIISGTANEIINTVSGDTNTLSLAPAITDAITANTAKTGITTAQAAAITTNTGKTGITTEQSNAIIANTAKVSNVDIRPLVNNWTNLNTFNSSNADIDFVINSNTSGEAYRFDAGSDGNTFNASSFAAYGTNTLLFGHHLTNDVTILSTPANGLIFNGSRLDKDFTVRKETTGEALTINAGADTMTIGSDVLTINSTTINGLPDPTKAQVDTAIGSGTLTTDYYASDKTWKSIPSGGTATTVQGTSGQIGVNTVGNTATVSLDTAITSAITANTAKTGISTAQASAITTNTAKVGITTAQATAITNNTAKTGITTAQSDAITANTSKVSVSGLTQVGGAIIGTDSVLYYDGTVPRRKVFSSVPLSIMNNDANFITGITKANVDTAIGSGTLTTDYYASDKTWKSIPSGGTATTVLGTTGEIDVSTVGSNATVSLSSTITDAIDLNTAKQSVAGLNQVGAAVLSTDSVVYYAGTALAPRRKTFSLVPLSVMNNDSGFTTNSGTVTSVAGTANQINVVNGTTTPVVSLNNTITSAITANTSKTGITTAQANAITANTAKVSNVNILPLANSWTNTNTFNSNNADIDFIVRNSGSGDAYRYDAGSDDNIFNASSFAGYGTNTLILGHNLTNDVTMLSTPASGVIFNGSRLDKDFTIRKQTTNNALNYNAGTDTLTLGAANIVGAASATTGTWTPVFTNGGTQGTTTAVWTKSGQNVIISCNATIAAGSANIFSMSLASLPFSSTAVGSSCVFGAFNTLDSSFNYLQGNVIITGFSVAFIDNVSRTFMNGNALLGTLEFTLTYRTDD